VEQRDGLAEVRGDTYLEHISRQSSFCTAVTTTGPAKEVNTWESGAFGEGRGSQEGTLQLFLKKNIALDIQ
jgi:hypothetical protein